MYRVGICGSFSKGKKAVGGQTIRTRIITNELVKYYGQNEIDTIDSDTWKNNPVSMLYKCIRMAITCKNIIILPAHNGIKVFIPLFVLLKSIFRKKLHYVVIGAWLADDLKVNKWLISFTKKIDVIYVQTGTLRSKLRELGIIKNVEIFPNFRVIENENEYFKTKESVDNSLKTCILSRVNKMKGISDAVRVINRINTLRTRRIYLDVYGPIEDSYKSEFDELLARHSDFLSYRGVVPHSKAVNTMMEYDLLLFPTKYFTEGFPGTIVDAYFAGLPVLASRWESSGDIIDEGKTGVIYEFDDLNDFEDKLSMINHNSNILFQMRKECIKKSKEFLSENVMKKMITNLN